jgi:hypothetical protein
MFVHAAFRPLWPVLLFLPWLVVGIAYLVESVLQRRTAGAAALGVHHLRSAAAGRGAHRTR